MFIPGYFAQKLLYHEIVLKNRLYYGKELNCMYRGFISYRLGDYGNAKVVTHPG
ncbi:MAG: hypothetical protein K6U80_09340 [Firmicutes bacterium]|nr:hypothetical protein [Bacillota bacterium]